MMLIPRERTVDWEGSNQNLLIYPEYNKIIEIHTHTIHTYYVSASNIDVRLLRRGGSLRLANLVAVNRCFTF